MECEEDEELNWPLIGGIGAGVFVLICLLFACCRTNKKGSNLMSAMMPALMMNAMGKNRDPPPPRYDEEQPQDDYEDRSIGKRPRPNGDPYQSGDAAPAPAYVSMDPGGQPPAYRPPQGESIDPLLQAGMQQSGPETIPPVQPAFDPYGQSAPSQVMAPPQFVQPAPAPASSFAPAPMPVPQMTMVPAPAPMFAPSAYGPPPGSQAAYMQGPPLSFAPGMPALSIQSGLHSRSARRNPKRSHSAKQPASGSQLSASRPSLAPTRSQSAAAWSASELKLQRSGSSSSTGNRRPVLAKLNKDGQGSDVSSDASRTSPPTEALPASVATKQSKPVVGSKVEVPVVVLSRSDYSGTDFRSAANEVAKSQASLRMPKRSKSEASIQTSRPKMAKASVSEVSYKSARSYISEDLLLPDQASTVADRPKPAAKSSASQASYKSARSDTSEDLVMPDGTTTIASSSVSESKTKRRRKHPQGLI